MSVVGWREFSTATLLGLMLVSARADEAALIDRWYSALLTADRTSLAELLSDDARIRLHDIGVEQTKPEFIASMDEWRGGGGGGPHRPPHPKTHTRLFYVILF